MVRTNMVRFNDRIEPKNRTSEDEAYMKPISEDGAYMKPISEDGAYMSPSARGGLPESQQRRDSTF